MNLYTKEIEERIKLNEIAMTTERYVKNRKYVAIVEEYGKTNIIDCTDLVGYDYDPEWNFLTLHFLVHDLPYWYQYESCTFYKKAKPPVLEEILKITQKLYKLKQNQT